LYPRKEDISKETVTKGKAKIQAKKLVWVPVKENPSGIGSSKAFAAPTESPIPVIDVLVDTNADPTQT